MADYEDDQPFEALQDDLMTPNERRKARNQQKKDEKIKIKATIEELLTEQKKIFEAGNRLIPSKLAKVETLADGSQFNKQYVITMQKLYLGIFESRINKLLETTSKKGEKPKNKLNSFSRPSFFLPEVMNWLSDPAVSFAAKDVVAFMHPLDGSPDKVEYSGQELRDVLLMMRKESTIPFEDDDGEKEVPLWGLASRAIVSDLLNSYIVKHNLKGVEVQKEVKRTVKDENGEKREVIETVTKIHKGYWRIDDTLLKYFGKTIDLIVENDRKKNGGKSVPVGGVEISRRCIRNASLTILSALVDNEANQKYKRELVDLADMIFTDAALVKSMYNHINN